MNKYFNKYLRYFKSLWIFKYIFKYIFIRILNILLNIQSSSLDMLDIHLDIYSVPECFKIIFMDVFQNICLKCSSTRNGLFHFEILSKIFISSTLVILDIHTWILFFASKYLYLKKNILAYFGFFIYYSGRPRPVAAVRLPLSLRYAAHQPPFLDLSLGFQQWLASISRHLCQK